MNTDFSATAVKGRAMVAMSGGVDSAVAALLMKQAGYDVTGVTMRLYRDGDAIPTENGADTMPDADTPDIADARRVAERLGIGYAVCHLEHDFCRLVIDPFVEAYAAGKTPNPCVICNKKLKFGAFLRWALEHDLPTVATGHYARISRDANGRYAVRKAVDLSKDQTYMFWSLTQDVLSHVRLPLGELKKSEVRQIAADHAFVNARKHDSQDICFIPGGDYAAFIGRYAGVPDVPGNFIDTNGNILGRHRGMIHYTIGQRKGLGIALGEPMYVSAKDAATGNVTLCRNEELFHRTLTAHDANWLPFDRLDAPLRVEAKIRYQHTVAAATVRQTGEGTLLVEFDEPQRAIASGQSVVFYDGDFLLGGGVID